MVRAFFDFLAKMGLSVRDDPPKVVDLSIREWGETREGLALSILCILRDDPDALPSISVVIRNVSLEKKTFTVPGWLPFYRLEVRLSDGFPVALSPFGRALARPERKGQQRLEVSLAAGALHETEVPLGSMFSLKNGGRYLVKACCEPFEGVVVASNETVVR